MRHEFRLADIGEGLEEAEIISWLVSVGDVVARDQPLIEVMTDKSNAELPAPAAGRVVELGGAVGDILLVGALIATIDDTPTAAAPDVPVETSPTGQGAAEVPDPDDLLLQTASPQVTDTALDDGAVLVPRPKASPSTRREALARGLDLALIVGSGPGGRILLSDLDNPVPAAPADVSAWTGASVSPSPTPRTETEQSDTEQSETEQSATAPIHDLVPDRAPPATPPPSSTPTTPNQATTPAPAVPKPTPTVQDPLPASSVPLPAPPAAITPTMSNETTPLRGIRRVVAQNMARSWFDIPHIHAYDHIDAQPLLDLRARMRATGHDAYGSLTPMTFFVAAVAKALQAHPIANASINMVEETITHHASINIGVAVAAPQGLVVPVVQNADQLRFEELSIALTNLIRSARDGSLSREQFQGGTATITNFGSLGGEQAAPLIRPGESIIVGFGSIKERPFVIDGQVTARNTMHIVAAADHRLLDGDVTTAFLRNIAETFTDPLDLVL